MTDFTGTDEELATILDGTYACTRVWEAWFPPYETMTEEDFIPAADTDVRGDLIAWRDAAVASALAARTEREP